MDCSAHHSVAENYQSIGKQDPYIHEQMQGVPAKPSIGHCRLASETNHSRLAEGNGQVEGQTAHQGSRPRSRSTSRSGGLVKIPCVGMRRHAEKTIPAGAKIVCVGMRRQASACGGCRCLLSCTLCEPPAPTASVQRRPARFGQRAAGSCCPSRWPAGGHPVGGGRGPQQSPC